MEGEPKREFIDPNDATLESHELFPDEPSGHTGDEWDEIAEKEMRPTEHKLGLEKKSEPVDPEIAKKYFEEAWKRIKNGPKKEIYQIPPHEPLNDMDRYAMEEAEGERGVKS